MPLSITPGPWTVDDPGIGTELVVTSTHYPESDTDVAAVYGTTPEAMQANAQAIAALPDLIAAARRAVVAIDPAHPDWYEKMDGDAAQELAAALRKAGAL